MSLEKQIVESTIEIVKNDGQIQEALTEVMKKAGFMPNTKKLEVIFNSEKKEVSGQHFKFEIVLKCLAAKTNIALIGPAGSGKTTVVRNAAEVLGLAFYSKSVSLQTGTHEFFGYKDAQGNYQSTLFREAYENGGVFLVDEFDAGNPNVLAALNQATANGQCPFPDGMIDKNPNFLMLMAGNTYGNGATAEYVGRNKIDAATLDRFVFIDFPYDESLEFNLSANKDWCNYIQKVRQKAADKKVRVIISPRATFQGEALIAAGVELNDVLNMVVYKSLSQDEINLIKVDLPRSLKSGGTETDTKKESPESELNVIEGVFIDGKSKFKAIKKLNKSYGLTDENTIKCINEKMSATELKRLTIELNSAGVDDLSTVDSFPQLINMFDWDDTDAGNDFWHSICYR